MMKTEIHHSMRRQCSGFTLVEVLVALAITGMLVAVLASSLFHVLRAQDALHDETIMRERQLRERAWFREILAGCLPVERGDAYAFIGDRQEIRCETTGSILPAVLPTTVMVKLTLTPEDSGVRLEYEESDGAGAVLFSRQQSQAEFRYVDASGAEQPRWPPEGGNDELLPRQVRLVLTSSAMGAGAEDLWLVAPSADPWPLERPALPPGMTWDMFKR